MEKASNKKLNLHAAHLEKLADFTLFDDTFMTKVFSDNSECSEYVLSVILGKKLKVTESQSQYDLKNLMGTSATLDIKAEDSEHRLYNIEVQRENNGAKPRRARRNGSLLDANCKDSGKYGEKLPETYVIFITENDYWGEGDPLYLFERKCSTGSGKNIDFCDGLHIIYVNGKYRGENKIGELMQDFSRKNPAEIKNGVLRKYATFYKTDKKGVDKMCKAMEELNEMAVNYNKEEMAMKLIKKGMPIDFIVDVTNLSEERILELQQEMLVEV